MKKKGRIRAKVSVLLMMLLIAMIPFAWTFSAGRAMAEEQLASVFRTVMIYMVGSDQEENSENGTRDLREMMHSGVNLDRTGVIVAAGGVNRWEMLDLSEGEMKILRLAELEGRAGFDAVTQSAARDMATPETLTFFLQTAMVACPAERYDLILWDHGGGPARGYGYDLVSGHTMQLADIARALSDAGLTDENKLEMIGFDACLMGSIEVATMMAPYAKYMVASEEVIDGNGWDYGFLGKPSLSEMDSERMIHDLCDAYDASKYVGNYTLSGIRLDSVGEVWQAMDAALREIPELYSAGSIAALGRTAAQTRGFGRFASSTKYDLYDLLDFAEGIRKELYLDMDSLKNALQGMIFCNVTNMSGAEGISFYYPLENRKIWPEYLQIYREMTAMSGYGQEYASFLEQVPPTQGQEEISDDMKSAFRILESGKSNHIYSMQLNEAQQERYVRGYYVILEQDAQDESVYYLSEKSTDVTLDKDGVLWTRREPFVFQVRADDASPWRSASFIEQERNGEIVHYWTTGVLTRFTNRALLETMVKSVEIQFETNLSGTESAFLQLVPDTESGLAPRELLTLESEDTLAFIHVMRNLTVDENENMLPYLRWKKENENVHAAAEVIVQGRMPEISRVEIREGSRYFLQLVMIDVNGNEFASDLMAMN